MSEGDNKVYPTEQLPVPLSESLLDMCVQLGITPEKLVSNILYGRGKHSYLVQVDDFARESLQFVPGHVWGAEPQKYSPGPQGHSEVMIVDKMMDRDGLDNRRVFSGQSGEFLYQSLVTTGHKNVANYYVTTLLKTVAPDSTATYKQRWSAEQFHLLLQEIYIVKPKYMLLMGADVLKMLLGKNAKLAEVEGVVQELEFCPPGEEPFKVKALVTMRPDALLYARTAYTQKKFMKQLIHFQTLVAGKKLSQGEEFTTPPGHKVIDNEYDLILAIREARRDSVTYSRGLMSVDCEWEGSHPQWRGAYLRCVQFTGKEGKAWCVALTHPGGKPRFKVRKDRKQPIKEAHKQDNYTTKNGTRIVAKYIGKLLEGRRLCGHQIKADLEWLEYYGMEAPGVYEFPDKPEDCEHAGPFDTMLAAHAYDEQADLGLKDQLAVHMPHIPNYEMLVQRGIKNFIASQLASGGHITKKSALEGYGNLADEDLYPYANWDVDATIQLGLYYLDKLSSDQYENDCWKAYHISIRAFPVAYEITKQGMTFDPEAANRITFSMMRKRSDLLHKIRTKLNWPDLNLNSAFHQRELLFGTRYNGKADRLRIRPPGALSLLAEPVLSTGKYQQEWEKIRAEGKEFRTRASCNGKVMGLMLLYSEHTKVRRLSNEGRWGYTYVDATEILNLLREYKAINQQLKGPLRPPTEPPPLVDDWDPDEPFFDKGIPGSVCEDGKVRTSILQIKETGRWSSVSPPLMNLSSAADALLKRIFKNDFPGSVKNVLKADKDWFLIPVDLSGAELRMCAVQSQDPDFIDATERISLPESHPDHMDIHGSIAVEAFGLPCRPTKSAIEEIGKGDLRT